MKFLIWQTVALAWGFIWRVSVIVWANFAFGYIILKVIERLS
jgi:hypothetical protein